MKPTLFNSRLLCAATCLALTSASTAFAKGNFKVTSPDGSIVVTVTDGDTLRYTISQNNRTLLNPSPIYMLLDKGQKVGINCNAKGGKTSTVKESIKAPFYHDAVVNNQYNQLRLSMKNGGVEFRVFNEGVAYRFNTRLKGDIKVMDEGADFRFAQDGDSWFSYTTRPEKPRYMAFQNYYTRNELSKQEAQLAFLPATVQQGDTKITILESDLESYPGMWLTPQTGATSVKASFAQYPSKTAFYAGRQQLYITDTHNYIAQTKGTRNYPWRVMAITTNDAQMPTNNLVYALASPNRIGDCSWVKPGKVAWDWWNDWGLEHVPFKAGINTETYKYYIDFAAKNGLEYVVLDEGWYVPKSGDMLTIIPDIDLNELIQYGKKKNVGIVLWTVFNVLDSQLEEACKKYSEMGVKGFKVDFLDRDDQTAVEMTYRIADACAKHHLFLDYHGIYKPTGMLRTYPNVINYEAVFGMEEVKWEPTDKDMPEYDVTMPFIRGMAGYCDFTPGAMNNASKQDWRPVYYHPMSQGTRCHQAGMYIVFDSPFTMLADSPSAYEKEPEYTQFIASIPTCFEETKIVDGKVGEYIVTLRRAKNGNYYLGALTNWKNGRDLNIDLNKLLPKGSYKIEWVADGPNAQKSATDYVLNTTKMDVNGNASAAMLNLHLVEGGGFAAIITRN